MAAPSRPLPCRKPFWGAGALRTYLPGSRSSPAGRRSCAPSAPHEHVLETSRAPSHWHQLLVSMVCRPLPLGAVPVPPSCHPALQQSEHPPRSAPAWALLSPQHRRATIPIGNCSGLLQKKPTLELRGVHRSTFCFVFLNIFFNTGLFFSGGFLNAVK